MNFDINHLYLTTDGRIGRQSFWIGFIGLVIASIVINVIVGALFGWASFAILLVGFIVQVVLAYPGYALMAKRFQDRGKPSIYAAIVIGISVLFAFLAVIGLTGAPGVPNAFGMLTGLIEVAIGIWIVIELGILRGTVGDNAYGPDPLQG